MSRPSDIAQWERTRNQKILQQKMEAKEREAQQFQGWVVDKIQQNLGIDPYIEAKSQAELERLMIAKEKQIREAEQAMRSIQREIEQRSPSIYSPPQAISFPHQLILTRMLAGFLEAQTMSGVRTAPLRAEILDVPQNGSVSVCVVFSRNGSSYVDVFVVQLKDIYAMGGLGADKFDEISKLDKRVAIPPQDMGNFDRAKPWTDNTGTLTLDDLDNAYKEATRGAINKQVNAYWDGTISGRSLLEKQNASPTEPAKKPFRLIDV